MRISMKWNRDCRSFPGTYSCEIMTSEGYESCEGCKFYDSITKKILILKLGAMGDVIRTTTILPALKKKYGQGIHITWIVNKESKDLLKNNKYIDKILVYNEENVLRLKQEKFDVLISLEVAPPATLIANLINAKEKFGFYFDEDGHPSCFNKESRFYLDIVFSNNVNKRTRRTYQEMIFEMLKLKYEKQKYILNLDENEKEYAKKLLKYKNEKLIGINVGAGGRWASKSWSLDQIIKLIKLINKKTKYKIVLLGGKQEEEVKNDLVKKLKKLNINVLQNDSNNNVREFMSIIDLCDVIITNDSLALHIAIGLNKKTIALFFVTPPWQIESYGIVKILSSPLFEDHFMDDQYNEELINSISAEEVFEKI